MVVYNQETDCLVNLDFKKGEKEKRKMPSNKAKPGGIYFPQKLAYCHISARTAKT